MNIDQIIQRHSLQKYPVKIRFKTLKNNNKSIYLDTYINGKRQYEFLHLYIVPEIDKKSHIINQNAIKLAYAIQAERILNIYGATATRTSLQPQLPIKLYDFIQQYAENHKKANDKEGRYATILTLCQHLEIMGAKNLPLNKVDESFCLKFINYLKNAKDLRPNNKTERPIAPGTAYLKFSIFRSILKEAQRQGLIDENPIAKLPASQLIHRPDSTRCYLTKTELCKLIRTPCNYSKLKEAFLFSCFTGLRRSDILNLKWGEIVCENRKWYIRKKIKKTQRWLTIPLSDEARKWLPAKRGNKEATVFPHMPSTSLSENVKKWAYQAGIKRKEVTFHVARHTFATLELSLGVDIYTVSKLLGHRSINTTQIYAKVIDKKKEKAIRLIDKSFSKKPT